MVDTRDLKSLGLVGRVGSSPAAGTTCWVIFPLKQRFKVMHSTLCTFLCTLLLTMNRFYATLARAPASFPLVRVHAIFDAAQQAAAYRF